VQLEAAVALAPTDMVEQVFFETLTPQDDLGDLL